MSEQIDQEVLKKLILKIRGSNSQRWLAELWDVDPQKVQGWENGSILPDDTELRLIAQSSSMSLEQIKSFLKPGNLHPVSLVWLESTAPD